MKHRENECHAFTFHRMGLVFVVTVLAALLLSSSCDAWEAEHVPYPFNRYLSWSPDGSRIAFESTRSETQWKDNQVWVVKADGTELTQLTNEQYGAGAPIWSRDGAHVYFIRWDENDTTDIWRVAADGSNREQVSHTNYDEFSFAISPDGTELVVDTERGIQIYTIAGAPDRYVAASGWDDDPDWAPDGTKIVFIRKGNVWIRNVDLTGLTQLTTGDYYEWTPRWSPDGTRIVFSSDRLGPQQLWFIAPDGTGLQRVMSDAAEPSSVGDDDPAWSRDGSKVAFVRDDGQSCDLWVVNTNGTGLTRLTHNVTQLAFDPDGGTYTGTQTVTISCATPGVTIRYTTDGSDPTETSTEYTEPVTVDHSLTLKAKAWKTDWFPSNVKSADYVIE